MKKLTSFMLAISLAGGVLPGCISSQDGQKAIEALENMSDLDFNKWKLYVSLGSKIGANRLLAEGLASENDLKLAATALETVRDQSVVPGTSHFIENALADIGLTNDEVKLLLIIVEQELASRGALEWIDPETGLFALSPRTKELLTAVADSLRAAANVSNEEVEQGQKLEAAFKGNLV